MLLLALDTATEAVTVALHDGTRLLAERTTVDARRHGELLAPSLVAVLADAGADRRDLTDVAVGVGPGPYTGLRVGLVTARVLAATLDLRLVGACTLDVVALDAALPSPQPFLVATDARRREVYWAAYDADRCRVRGPDVGPAAQLPGDMPVAGRGAQLSPELLARAVRPEHPSAGTLAAAVVGGTVELLPPQPRYLRRPDAVEAAARKRVP